MKSRNKWIGIYETFVKLTSIASALVGVICIFTGNFLYAILAIAGAGINLMSGELLVTFFENVQVIREKMEVLCGSQANEQATQAMPEQVVAKKKNTIMAAAPVNVSDTELEFTNVVCPKCNSKISVPKGKSKWFCPLCSSDIEIK